VSVIHVHAPTQSLMRRQAARTGARPTARLTTPPSPPRRHTAPAACSNCGLLACLLACTGARPTHGCSSRRLQGPRGSRQGAQPVQGSGWPLLPGAHPQCGHRWCSWRHWQGHPAPAVGCRGSQRAIHGRRQQGRWFAHAHGEGVVNQQDPLDHLGRQLLQVTPCHMLPIQLFQCAG
jgi:hypothetical protein